MIEAFVPESTQLLRNGHPRPQENRNDLLSVAADRVASDRDSWLKELLKSRLNLRLGQTGHLKVGGSLEPRQLYTLAETDRCLASRQAAPPKVTNGTINSSRQIPPCPTSVVP